ncbi:protein flbB [Aspergillus mulundensis]|uniref:BZIP-type transcription factor n=1 Tax=Aspergillus mulundensis TaxID=1810919 RepID=A0A3D8RKX3_9EURO|nr:BZIP-type transcription factor [Aspergillus mulundensis]RDW74596.1 BZIP-type transcription factor [Aspergillus mulundensis]
MRGSISTDFFRLFSGGAQTKKTTRDGQPAKRRGPKPDSKPALTRRQELNRQAQRTHRERKEQYIRALESEVARLREAYTQEISAANLAVHQHREMVSSVSEENNMLKEILAAHNINIDAELERRRVERPMGPVFHSSPVGAGSVGSQTGVASFTAHTYSTPPTTVSSSGMSPKVHGVEKFDFSSVPDAGPSSHGIAAMPCDALAAIDRRPPIQGGGIFEDHPQLQIDFILALESPCREHTDYLCRRSVTEADDEDMPFSGHALMATCPPPSYISNTTSEQTYPHKTYDLPHANLTTLLNLSRQLVTEGQVTPIMALQALKSHDMYTRLTRDDVKLIMDTLENKVRCYGFGAVLEDFELMDCFSSVLGSKIEGGISFSQPADETLYA